MTLCNNSANKTGAASPANQPLTWGLPVVTIPTGFRCTGGGDELVLRLVWRFNSRCERSILLQRGQHAGVDVEPGSVQR
jgi:hypothetical protein